MNPQTLTLKTLKNPQSQWTFALGIKGSTIGIIDRPIYITVVGYGDVDTTVTVTCTKPDGTTITIPIAIRPKTYGYFDARVVEIEAKDVDLSGVYSIVAETTINATVIRSNTLNVNVPAKIRTITYRLLDPEGKPMPAGFGTMVLIHKPTSSVHLFATDQYGLIKIPEFKVNTDWILEVHWRNPQKYEEFDLKIYEPLNFAEVPTTLQAIEWVTEKFFKMEVDMTREKFLDLLAIKNPILAKEPVAFIDVYPRHTAMIVANEILGGIPFMEIYSAHYDSKAGKLTVVFKGLGIGLGIALVILACIIAVVLGVSYWAYTEMKKEEARTEAVKARVEVEKEYMEFSREVLSALEAGKITPEEAGLLLGSLIEYSEKWKPAPPPPIIPPELVWVIALVGIGVVIFLVYWFVIRRR